MISLKVEVHKGEEDMKEDYKRFVKVQDQYASYNVPTKEEYEDLIEKLRETQKDLETRLWGLAQKGISLQDRIATLEKETERKNESPKEEELDEDKEGSSYKAALFSIANGGLEITGTEEQYKTFEKSREEIDKSLFPKFLTYDKLVRLALDCGLTVKKIEWK